MQRRTFLQSTAAVATASLSSLVSRANQAPAPLIVDTHQHLWDLAKFQLPWLAGAPEVLKKTYHTAEYAEATRGLNVRCVYMEVNVDPAQESAEADHVIALSKLANPTVAAVIGCRPESDGFAAYVERFRGVPEVKGMRRVLHEADTPTGFCLQDRFVRSMQLLGERGLSYDLCMRPTELNDAARLTELCPDTRFIVDHCGNADAAAFSKTPHGGERPASHTADEWKAGIDRLARRPNTICKISGIIARLRRGGEAAELAPIVNHCLDAFGPDRVVFGSDWPVCLLGAALKTWVSMLGEIVAGRSEADRRKLWSENAKRFYQLSL
jgi:predicted TIM-barrel fold metal-dependent hydrolase